MDYKSLEIIEKKFTVMDAKFPYIPGFLSYREAIAAVETYHKLEADPDVLIVKGNGILHPKKIGIASHLGLLIDKPTIGVAKNILCGELKENTVYMEKEAVGKKMVKKEHAKPIFISPGHRITLNKAAEIIKIMLKKHKLPEPLHEAHKYANKIKRKEKQEPETEDKKNN